MRAMLEAAGRSVHVYTSPHLVRFNERFRLGAPGGGAAGRRRGAGRRARRNASAPTAASRSRCSRSRPPRRFLLFSRQPADVLLLEVGLGGRLDATNVIDKPLACAITPVSMDHLEFLGDTIEKIAAEKAAILKRGVPAAIAPQADAVLAVIERQAKRVRAPLRVAGEHWSVHERARPAGLSGRRRPARPAAAEARTAATSSTTPAPPSRRCAPPGSRCRLRRSRPASPRPNGRRGCSASRTAALEGADAAGERALARRRPQRRRRPRGCGGARRSRGARAAPAGADRRHARRPRTTSGFLRNFAGIARRVIAVPIPRQDKSVPAAALADMARGVGIPAESRDTLEAALAAVGRLELAARAAHPDHRLALSRRRGAGAERHAAGMIVRVIV